MTTPNQEQIEFWNGKAGTEWVRAQEHLDALLSPLSERALQAAQAAADERVLDIGCGCGATSLLLAEQAQAVTGVDISAPMVARAQERAAGRGNVTFIEADASTWRASEPFDLAFSRFGVMFFEDAAAAFANIHSNLKPGGRLCFICWRMPADNPWLAIPGAAAAPFLPEPPPADGPGPFAFADQDYVGDVLAKAGFSEPAFELCEATLNVGRTMAEAMDFLTRVGPLSRVIAELEPPAQAEALAAVEAALEPHLTDTGINLGGSCWIVKADAVA